MGSECTAPTPDGKREATFSLDILAQRDWVVLPIKNGLPIDDFSGGGAAFDTGSATGDRRPAIRRAESRSSTRRRPDERPDAGDG